MMYAHITKHVGKYIASFFLNDLMVRHYWNDSECKGKLSHCRP